MTSAREGETPSAEEWDVVVVGAGTAGCPLAARLADAGRRVLLLEAGADHADFPPELLDADRMGAAVRGHPANWDLPAELLPGRRVRVARGRVVGGSSALNAAAFLRCTPEDLDGWVAAGNHLWSYARVLPAFCRLEADRDHGDRPEHGADGPIPVSRPTGGGPLAEALAAAAAELGFPVEADKNAGAAPGYGPVPRNVADGVRVNTALAYLVPRRGLRGLTVRGGVTVQRVLVERGRAVGVQTDAGVVHAAEVVLSAGAVGSAHLLLRSGIGPADQLRAAGVAVVADLPGVGDGFTDHPAVHVGYRPVPGLPEPGPPLAGVLHATSAGAAVPGDLELLPWLAPFRRIMTGPCGPGPGPDDELTVGVGLQAPDSRGRLTLSGPDPAAPPRLEYGYLESGNDRRRLREGVRLVAELLRTRALAPLVAERTGPGDDVLAHDRALDGWVRAHLTTAVHLAGTARMGTEADPGAVVDQRLRVRGVAGLRIVDTSVFPRAGTRGTAATAVMLGERAAELALGAG